MISQIDLENEFFREVSIRICGSLEIHKALWMCFQYVRKVMPLDELLMTCYDQRLGTMEIVAVADEHAGKTSSDYAPLSPPSRRELEDHLLYPRVRKVNSLEDTICRHVGMQRGWEESSVLVNRLLIEDKYIGAFGARAVGKDRYTEEHLRLWTLINEPAAIALANFLQYREISKLKDILADEKSYLESELRKSFGDKVVGSDSGLKQTMQKVRMVAPLPSPVLISGETGTGKEIIANAIHDLSKRSDGPLIKVNCGAIPETLIDSVLFGHEKGAFTGASDQKRGLFERADGGTIFLDEVSELPPAVQVRLLRVLQEKEFERVGGSAPIKIDVRIVSATNRDLLYLVEQKKFREDLYFRLIVFPILLPPLRERKSDIPALINHFIQKKCREMGLRTLPCLGVGMIDQLMAYEWPGNVRELENAVERAIIISNGKELIFSEMARLKHQVRSEAGIGDAEVFSLAEMEARHIRHILAKTKGRINGPEGAAELLRMNSGTLRHRMKKLGIPFGRNAA
ncbi:MAG: Fis family transcriptional regulator [Deltaproteobacteria bacterium HGW-Deltaproteobacteria-10]|nr:MAG: Fis family transcriptional regulator [Deltaproteobacteria bacterium HGW-Deltaproteobacteria-10]